MPPSCALCVVCCLFTYSLREAFRSLAALCAFQLFHHLHMGDHYVVSTLYFCSLENLMARVEQSKALSHQAKPIAFLFKATKTSEATKSN
jgi:hypothetical protein